MTGLLPSSLVRSIWLRIALSGVAGSLLVTAPESRAQSASGTVADLPAPFSRIGMADLAAIETGVVWDHELARRAVQAGLYPIAEGYFRQALARPGIDQALRDELLLGLSTALIGMEEGEKAAAELDKVVGARQEAWLLRRAAVDFLARDFAALGPRLAEIRLEMVAAEDFGTYHFLRASQLDDAGESARADVAYEEAFNRASSNAQRALFRLVQYQRRLSPRAVSESDVATIRASIDRNQGQSLAHRYTLTYAVVLDQLGRKAEALEALRRLARALPAEEAELRDQTWLVQGLIAGADSSEGREAFSQLVQRGSDADYQRAALIQLASAVPVDGGPAGAIFQRLLDQQIALPQPHPLLGEMLFFRAELALRDRAYERAELDANALLTRFPGSSLGSNAFALLASSSWQQKRYRAAAGSIAQIRAGMPPGGERTDLGVLMGECHYRAGIEAGTAEDFRNAAEAYGAAQAEIEAGAGASDLSLGAVFFQRVLSLIRGGSMDAAVSLLDRPETAGVDDESRWQAEWNLARFLQLESKPVEALTRVDRLDQSAVLSPELRLRVLWLGAQLTLETGRARETRARVDRVGLFLRNPEAAGLGEERRREVESKAALLAAQAELELGNTEDGVAAMERVRADFPGSDAAAYSFIVQARALAAADRFADAQNLLIKMAESNQDSRFAPIALYEAASLAERLGQDVALRDASQLLRTLADRYPEDRYVFAARLKQADVMRRLNQLGLAEETYKFLENTFPDHSERALVEVSLADTLMAQAIGDPVKFEGAVARYERLMDQTSAPLDLRVEAGVKLAYGWRSQMQPDRAARVFWDVTTRFGDAQVVARLGTGRYWVTRALVELADYEEKAGRIDNARRLLQTVLDRGLPAEKTARARLARFQGGG